MTRGHCLARRCRRGLRHTPSLRVSVLPPSTYQVHASSARPSIRPFTLHMTFSAAVARGCKEGL